MPIYAYKCEPCGHAKDVLQKMSDAPLTDCPQCGAAAFKKQLTAAGFQLKGSGWYVTDFRGGAQAAAPAADGADPAAPAASKSGEAAPPAKAGVTPAAPAASAATSAAPAAAPAAPSPPPASSSAQAGKGGK